MLPVYIDKEVIDACLNGQAQSQELLYRTCYPVFMKICLRYTDSYDDAANVLQESFIKIFSRLNDFKGSGDFVGWMRRIVVNTSIDHVRKQKLQGHQSIDTVPEIAEEPDAEFSKYVIDEMQLLKLIRELPKMQSLVFNLFVLEDYSHQMIAEQLSIKVSQSKWYLFDARKILQKKLSHYVND